MHIIAHPFDYVQLFSAFILVVAVGTYLKLAGNYITGLTHEPENDLKR